MCNFTHMNIDPRVLFSYMNDSVIVETGTHEDLLRRGGEYARIWNLQAQAFL